MADEKRSAKANEVRYYQGNVSAQLRGSSPRPSEADVENAADKFLTQALEENPNGTQGDPELVSYTHQVGGFCTMTFRVALVTAPVEGLRNTSTEGSATGDKR